MRDSRGKVNTMGSRDKIRWRNTCRIAEAHTDAVSMGTVSDFPFNTCPLPSG